MARRLSPTERRDLAAKAYRLALARVSYTETARLLGISRQLASTLVKEEQDRIREERGKEEIEMLLAERERAIGALDEVIRHAWGQLKRDDVSPNSTYQVGYINSIIKAQLGIVRILGLTQMSCREEGDELKELVRVVGESPTPPVSPLHKT